MDKQDKSRYDMEYSKKFIKQFKMNFNMNNPIDKTLYDWFNNQSNKSDMIKTLLYMKMAQDINPDDEEK